MTTSKRKRIALLTATGLCAAALVATATPTFAATTATASTFKGTNVTLQNDRLQPIQFRYIVGYEDVTEWQTLNAFQETTVAPVLTDEGAASTEIEIKFNNGHSHDVEFIPSEIGSRLQVRVDGSFSALRQGKHVQFDVTQGDAKRTIDVERFNDQDNAQQVTVTV